MSEHVCMRLLHGYLPGVEMFQGRQVVVVVEFAEDRYMIPVRAEDPG